MKLVFCVLAQFDDSQDNCTFQLMGMNSSAYQKQSHLNSTCVNNGAFISSQPSSTFSSCKKFVLDATWFLIVHSLCSTLRRNLSSILDWQIQVEKLEPHIDHIDDGVSRVDMTR